MNQWSQNHEEQLYNLSVKYESVKSESWRTIIQLYIYNKSSFTNGNDSLMKTITFINEDTIRYKYYCHENGKWKANRCKNCLCHEHFLQSEEESYFIIFWLHLTSNGNGK